MEIGIGLPNTIPVLDYYTPMGADIAEMIAKSAVRSLEAVNAAMGAFAKGVDELIFGPTIADVEQVDLLAEAVL